jgi:CubicO group peptidase (beta-lactamase class C family)
MVIAKKVGLAWVTIVFASSSLAFGAGIDVARMERAIDLRVSTGQFMGAVLVAKDGKILINKGYGTANLDWKVPNSPTTRFRLGSVTKQFTAACILLLEEQAKLKIGDPVKKYLPDAPAAWDRITIFNLLTHTSGIPNFTEFPDYRATEATPTTPEELVARFRAKPLDFAPGTGWHYSNSGYVLLGYLIEKISGEPYSKFLQENILTPLGMKDSGYDSNTEIIPQRAVGYAPGHGRPVVAGYIDMSIPFSAGGLYSTTKDLLRWEEALYGQKLLTPASLWKMTTPFRENYALGLMVRKTSNGDRVFSHGGGIEGFNTWVGYIPAENVAVIVLANLNGVAPDNIANDLTKVADGEKVTLISDRRATQLPNGALDRLAGHYQFLGGAIMAVWRDGRRFLTQLPEQPAVEQFPEKKGDFFSKVVDAQIAFNTDARGQVTSLVLHQNGRDQTATRTSDDAAEQILADLKRRIKENIPAPGTEAALLHQIETLERGEPDYDAMGPGLVEATRQQLPQITVLFKKVGALRALKFNKVLPNGSDLYLATFEHGEMECTITPLSLTGKVTGDFYHLLP